MEPQQTQIGLDLWYISVWCLVVTRTPDGTTADPNRAGPVEHIGAVSGCDQNTPDGNTADPNRAGPVEHVGAVSGCDQNTPDGTTADPDRAGPVVHIGVVSGHDQSTPDKTQQTLVLAVVRFTVISSLCFLTG